MTLPSVAARNAGAASANVTTTALPLPASIAANDLLVAWIAIDGTALPTWGTGFAGWNVLAAGVGGSACVGMFLYKIATGTESGNLGITTPSEAWAGRTIRLTGYDPNSSPDLTTTSNTTANPDPPSHNPAAWGTEDALWLALAAGDGNLTFSGTPTNYSQGNFQLSTNATTTDRVGCAFAERTANLGSDNPSAFTRSAGGYLAATAGIRGAQTQLQNILRSASFYSASGTTPTNAFTLDAGTNRRVMVSVAHETTSVTVSSMTYGGVSMALVTDGTDTAASTNTGRVEWWTLPESSLPSNGSQNLIVTLSATAEVIITIMVVNNTDQSTNVRDVVNANTASATTVTTSCVVGHPEDLVLSCCNANNAIHFTNYTVNSVRAMGRGSGVLPTGGAFIMNVANTPGATGTFSVVSTVTTATRQVMCSVVLAPFTDLVSGAVTSSAAAVTGSIQAAVNVTGAVTSSAAAVTGSLTAASGIDVSGAVASTAASVSGSIDTPKNVSGAVSSTVASVTGSIQLVANVSGAVSSSSAVVTGALQTPKNVSGAVSSATAAVSGSIDTPKNISGAVTSAAAAVTGALQTPKNVSGAVSSSSATVSGTLQVVVNVSGAVTSSSAVSSGSLDTPKNVSGAVASAAAAVTGSITLDNSLSLSGAVSSAAPAVSGTLQVEANLSGSVTSSPAGVSGALQVVANLSGSVTSSSPSATGTLDTPKNISGAVTSAAASVTGTINIPAPVDIAGAVTSSAPAVAGTIDVPTPANVSGAVTSTPATVSGTLFVALQLAGTLISSPPQVTGAFSLGSAPVAPVTASCAVDIRSSDVQVQAQSASVTVSIVSALASVLVSVLAPDADVTFLSADVTVTVEDDDG